METIQIQIFHEAEIHNSDAPAAYAPANFGGVVPQPGDLVALPADPAQQREQGSASDGRMRTVIERYFRPTSSDRIQTARVSLLVRPLQADAPDRRDRAAAATPDANTGTTKADIPFIIQQIYSCLHLARDCGDEEVAAALRKVAVAYADKAISLGADPKTLPRFLVRES